MSSASEIPIDQHNAEIQENLRHWERKALLREQYQLFYDRIRLGLNGIPEGPVLECGSGIGNLKSALPQAITSDLFPNPWLDRQENVYALSFGAQSLAAVVLFDVFHHLEYPGAALAELHRVLQPGGRVAIFEPAAGLLGRVVLGLFHHEPLALGDPITWQAPADFRPDHARYYAAQGNAWRIFGRRSKHPDLAGWERPQVHYFPALPWLLTGGFRGPQLCPPSLVFLAKGVDRLLQQAPRFFASRMLVILQKSPAKESAGHHAPRPGG